MKINLVAYEQNFLSRVSKFRVTGISILIAGTLVSAHLYAEAEQSNACWVVNFEVSERFVRQSYGNEKAAVTNQWRSMIRNIQNQPDSTKIRTVNDFFHSNLTYQTDMRVHGIEDYWTTPLETIGQGVGDCEDYAIAKYISLRLAGVEASKLRLIYVRAQIGGPRSSFSQAHMVLGYFETPSSEPLILDSLVRNILPASERDDLTPVFSFNSNGLWAGSTGSRAASSPTSRLSRWRNVIERMEQQGIYLEHQ